VDSWGDSDGEVSDHGIGLPSDADPTDSGVADALLDGLTRQREAWAAEEGAGAAVPSWEAEAGAGSGREAAVPASGEEPRGLVSVAPFVEEEEEDEEDEEDEEAGEAEEGGWRGEVDYRGGREGPPSGLATEGEEAGEGEGGSDAGLSGGRSDHLSASGGSRGSVGGAGRLGMPERAGDDEEALPVRMRATAVSAEAGAGFEGAEGERVAGPGSEGEEA